MLNLRFLMNSESVLLIIAAAIYQILGRQRLCAWLRVVPGLRGGAAGAWHGVEAFTDVAIALSLNS